MADPVAFAAVRRTFGGVPAGWLRSGWSAVIVLAILGGLCFGVQAVALGRPDSAELALVHSLALLRAHPEARAALDLHGPAAAVVCGPGPVGPHGCPVRVERWFEHALGRGAEVTRQPVVVGGRREYAFRIVLAQPDLELLVRSSGLPVGLAVLSAEPLTGSP